MNADNFSKSTGENGKAPHAARGRLVSDLEQLYIGDLVKGNRLRPGHSFQVSLTDSANHLNATCHAAHLEAEYRYRTAEGAWERRPLTIGIEITQCAIRGNRFWFLCPATRCRRRCEVLFFSEKTLRCRKCLGLSHASRYWSQRDRAIRSALDIRAKLGESIHEILGAVPKERPAGMSQRRYEKLCDELDDLMMLI